MTEQRSRHWSELSPRRRGITERWRKRQTGWASLAEIAAWCARNSGTIELDEDSERVAFTGLRDAIINGEFDRNGRCMVLSLNPVRGPYRMDRELLESEELVLWGIEAATARVRGIPAGDPIKQILIHCWAPRDLCRAWFEKRRLTPPLWLSDASSLSAASPAPADFVKNKLATTTPTVRPRAPDSDVRRWYEAHVRDCIESTSQPSEAVDMIAARRNSASGCAGTRSAIYV